MSLTKSYVTKQEIEQARQLDLLSYLQRHEPEELVRFSSHVYTLRSHDSLKISNGKWYQWSTGIGGVSALDYLIKVQGIDFVSAVSKILKYSPLAEPAGPTPAKRQRSVFTMPTPYENNDRVRTYLTGRGLSMDLLRMCIDAGLVYEDMRHNCVFMGFDRKKVPRYAMLRSSSPYSTFLGEVSGSDKRYSFRLLAKEPINTVHLFEAAIDLLSYATYLKCEGKDYRTQNLLSLSGVYQPKKKLSESKVPIALSTYLKENPQIKTVVLHLDNDKTGRLCTAALTELLKKDYEIVDSPPPVGKDVNDFLMSYLGLSRQKPVRERSDVR